MIVNVNGGLLLGQSSNPIRCASALEKRTNNNPQLTLINDLVFSPQGR